jgi:hypothetical protein
MIMALHIFEYLLQHSSSIYEYHININNRYKKPKRCVDYCDCIYLYKKIDLNIILYNNNNGKLR